MKSYSVLYLFFTFKASFKNFKLENFHDSLKCHLEKNMDTFNSPT